MKKRVAAAVLAIVGSVSLASAQALPRAQKPDLEWRRQLDYFVGTWKLTGETKASPFGRGGEKFSSTEQLEWMPGRVFLVARSYEQDTWTELTVLSYDAGSKLFTHTSYRGTGQVDVMKGTADGDTMILSEDAKVGGQPVKQRMTIHKVSHSLYTFKFEMAKERDSWSLVYEGQGTKTSPV
jgi:Protein of unknown function (DUF1579)